MESSPRAETTSSDAQSSLATAGTLLILVLLPIAFGLGRPGGMELDRFRAILTGSFDSHAPLTRAILQFLAVGAVWTVCVALAAILVSLPAATALALGRMAQRRPLALAATAAIESVRALPVLLLIYYIYFRLGNASYRFVPRDALAVTLALAIYTSAVNAEIIRAGILSLPKEQFEAAHALGLTGGQTLYHVILPQTLRRVLGPLIAQFATVLKDTSLGAVIGTVELAQRGKIVFQKLGNPLETYYLIAIIYFALNFLLGRLSEWIAHRQPR